MSNFIVPIKPIKPLEFSTGKAVKSDEKESSIPFSDILKNAVQNYETQQSAAEQDADMLTVGETDNLAQIQINSMKANAALSTTVQLTSRVVTAYKEVMQMQI